MNVQANNDLVFPKVKVRGIVLEIVWNLSIFSINNIFLVVCKEISN